MQKTFKVAQVRDLLNQVHNEKITFSRFVEILNEHADLMFGKNEVNRSMHKTIDEQVEILKDTLEEMMTVFDTEENRMDFILDICSGYRKRISK